MGYRKKAFRLEIRRGENGGYVVESPEPLLGAQMKEGIIRAIGEEVIDAVLRTPKVLKEQKPPELCPPVEGPGDVPPA